MKAHTLSLHSIAAFFIVGLSAQAAAPSKDDKPDSAPETARIQKMQKPKVEVIFVLDTTGSMGGLIEGAKQKIWSIANDIISAKPKPEVRFGLVGYRDRGDAYVTKRADLTDDLDKIHAQLHEFKANGGGDTPESVSEALHEAIAKMPWSEEGNVLRVIYLVGDAPPQQYQDGKDWKKMCQKAQAKGIHINTIQCGNIAGTAEVWKAIATRSEGAYALIPQDGNMVAIDAPQDKELSELNVEIGKTLIPCGSKNQRQEVTSKQIAAESAKPADNASRLSYNWKSEKTVQGSGELIDSLKEGKVKLDEVSKDQLPEELSKLSESELKAHVEEQQAKRADLQSRVATLVKERDAYLQLERKKMAASGQTNSFDEQVSRSLHEQAAKHGIAW